MKIQIIIILIFVVVNLSAYIINIPADYPTIQEGINASIDSDSILVQPATYYENINYNGKNITLASLFLTTQDTTFISQTIIDGNQDESVVSFEAGEDSTAVLIGFTITNGFNEYGGGIYISNSSPKIENCKITLNQAFDFGAGICLMDGTPIIKNNEISFNSTPYGPSDGIYCSPSDSIKISGNKFIDNGIFCWGGSFNNLYIINNIFENFICDFYKKAIEISGTSTTTKTVHIIDNYFSNFIMNEISSVIRVGGTGDAINTAIIERNHFVDLECPAVTLAGTGDAFIYGDIINNSFINCGTGMEDESVINLGGTGTVTVYASIIGNLILESSTGIKVNGISGSQLNGVFINNTIANNNKGIEKGSNVNQLQIFNTILWNNEDDLVNIAELEIQFSNISDGDYSGINGNISETPLFVGTGEYPFSLLENSPCIDAGSPDTTGLNLPEYDLLGNERIYNDCIDIGAYEWQATSLNNYEVDVLNTNISNYPNPFNPETTISFSIPENSKVDISIFNIKGQKIKTLVHNEFVLGNHSFIWKGDDDSGKLASSGVYLYKLMVNGKIEAIKRCLLLK